MRHLLREHLALFVVAFSLFATHRSFAEDPREIIEEAREISVRQGCGDDVAEQKFSLSIPKDVPYRVEHQLEIISRNGDQNGVEVQYLESQGLLTIRAWATQHRKCWSIGGIVRFGPGSWIHARVKLRAERNACRDAAPEPQGDMTIDEATSGWQKRQKGLRCMVAAANNRQQEIIQRFRTKIVAKATAREGAEKVRIAGNQAVLAEIRAAAEDYVQNAAALSPAFHELIAQFSEAKTRQAPETNRRLVELALEAKAAALEKIPGIQIRLQEIAESEASLASRLSFRARRLLGEYDSVETRYQKRLARHREFMKEHELAQADAATPMQEALRKLLASTGERARAYAATIRELGGQIQARKAALIRNAAKDDASAAMADALRMEAANRFAKEVGSEASQLWPDESKEVPMPRVLEAEYLQKRKFLRFEDICVSELGSKPWMRIGCGLAAGEYGRIQAYFKRGIPRRIRESLERLQASGTTSGDEATRVEELLKSGSLAAAVQLHDELVRRSAR